MTPIHRQKKRKGRGVPPLRFGYRFAYWATATLILVSQGVGLEHNLDSYLQVALQNNKALASAQSQLRKARIDSRVAGTLPGPSAMVEVRAAPQTSLDMVGIAQVFPLPQVLLRDRALARIEVSTTEQVVQENKVAVAFGVREIYARLYETGEKIRAYGESLSLLTSAEEIARVSYTNGRGTQSAILKLQMEMASVENDIHSAESVGNQLRHRLATVLSNDSALSAPYPGELPVLGVPNDKGMVEEIAREQNPAVLKAWAMEERASALVRLLQAKNGPQFKVGVSGGPMDNDGEKWMAKLSVEAMFPFWFGSAGRRVRAAQEEVAAAKAYAESEEEKLVELARKMLEEYREAVEKIALYDDVLVPQATQIVNLSLQEYRTGKISAVELLDSQQKLLQYQIRKAAHERRREIAAAEIVVCCLAQF